VYSGPLRPLHYALEDGERTLCGHSVRDLGLHRWASQWSLTDADRRCKRCDVRIGPRGAERHGPTTEADILLFGLAPSWLSPAELEAFSAEHARDEARFRSVPPPAGATFKDPPFELATDPHRIRGTLESLSDRVVNEVYAQVREGLRWHRIVELYQPSSNNALGRTYYAACSYGVLEFERDPRTNQPEPSNVSTIPPPPDELCQTCLRRTRKRSRR
jgi:hypothetical protein